jgi:DNA-binding LytR/AlgR family response regulator
VDTILFFYSEEKATFCVTTENRSAILDHTLDELSDMLDPAKYFRINRKYLVSSSSIRDIISYSNSRLKLVLKNSTDTEIIVAREKVQEFKRWLDV